MRRVGLVLFCGVSLCCQSILPFSIQREVWGESPGKKEASASRSLYQIQAAYEPSRDEVTGTMRVRLPVTVREPQTEAYFHLYPNVFQDWKYRSQSRPRHPGFLKVSQVKVNGVPASFKVEETRLQVRFPQANAIGHAAVVEMAYCLHLPEGGVRLNTYRQTAFLAQWYPMLVVKDQEGWHQDPYTPTGDPFYSQVADFDVTFSLPTGYRVISTGVNPPPQGSGKRQTVRVQEKDVRDFVAVLTKDYRCKEGEVDGTRVHLWYLPEARSVSDLLTKHAVAAMGFYNQTFGRYPYSEVDVVLGDTGEGIAGMEYPGLITSLPYIEDRTGKKSPAINVVAHELAHQWWYGVVGNNQVKEPWLDEGLTTFSEFLYMTEKEQGKYRDFFERVRLGSDQVHARTGLTSVESLYRYPDAVYGLMVYARPAAMLFQLMDEIGKEKVYQILKTYYQRYRYQVATANDFFAVANEVAGKDLTPFFQRWLTFKSH
jgi:hypothetical protein